VIAYQTVLSAILTLL